MSRPTINRIRSGIDSSRTGRLATTRPSFSTVARSASSKISASRWEMYRIPRPCERSSLITRNTRSSSIPDRTADGSSKMSTRACRTRARAISTSCRSATLKLATSVSRRMRAPILSSAAAASRLIRRWSSRRSPTCFSEPRNTFSSTVRAGIRLGS